MNTLRRHFPNIFLIYAIKWRTMKRCLNSLNMAIKSQMMSFKKASFELWLNLWTMHPLIKSLWWMNSLKCSMITSWELLLYFFNSLINNSWLTWLEYFNLCFQTELTKTDFKFLRNTKLFPFFTLYLKTQRNMEIQMRSSSMLLLA